MSSGGVCKIKPEFVIREHPKEVAEECVSIPTSNNEAEEPSAKRKKLSKYEKKKLKGQNKSRPAFRCDKSLELCSTLMNLLDGENIPACPRKNCPTLHDIDEYLEKKPQDINETCYNFEIQGECSRGLGCRFGKQHIINGRNIINTPKKLEWQETGLKTINQLKNDVQQALRKRTYNFEIAQSIVEYNNNKYRQESNERNDQKVQTLGAVTDEDIIALLKREKKKIDFKNKLVLSPLTTVGNLPFRRICKEYGADVTCGEMAMCSALLQGAPQEWALVKRHQSENIFGVQLCANNPYLFAKCGQLLEKEIEVDYIDVNLGCPIDLVYREGAGCGLLRRPKVLETCIRSLCDVLTIPVTVKTRMGIYNSENIAHNLVPKFQSWGAAAVTIHGRTKEQRYTKQSDWNYIEECAKSSPEFPIIGNGDILCYKDYKNAFITSPSISAVMIGRGALIKPWIFQEIKEQKLFDISSSERFEVIKKYVNYGLEHWGSDNKGVETTRRFLLEWLSFLYRYIPTGLLECPPQKINERPPYFKGRDDLETLMVSPSASDWIKISEMLLGKVPEGFQFLPKHKANSYK
nr:tRNA-dihydrouridine(47) synthase [NAD(P)(+)]-like [Onthophagus taurus]